MTRSKQVARKSTGGRAPHKQLFTNPARSCAYVSKHFSLFDFCSDEESDSRCALPVCGFHFASLEMFWLWISAELRLHSFFSSERDTRDNNAAKVKPKYKAGPCTALDTLKELVQGIDHPGEYCMLASLCIAWQR